MPRSQLMGRDGKGRARPGRGRDRRVVAGALFRTIFRRGGPGTAEADGLLGGARFESPPSAKALAGDQGERARGLAGLHVRE